MPFFAYRGRNPRGELIEGRLESSDSGAVADQLANTGVTPIDIQQASGADPAAPAAPGALQRLLAPSITLVDLMLFSRQMFSLLKAGVPIMRALAGLEESSTNPTLTAVIADLRASLDSGRELSAAMRQHPKVF